MNNPLILTLKQKLDDLAPYEEIDVETKRNVLKEELQFHVLNFIYHHPEYGKWIMYGGSALRKCHGLNRMSIDLDFEIKKPCTDEYLKDLKKILVQHFKKTYDAGSDFLTVKITRGRGVTLRFLIGDELGIGHPSKQVNVKIDLNQFVLDKAVTERIPVNHDQLAFVIVVYNMSALMASKIAAIFLRGERGIGKAVYEEKGRDIYDLLWYMEKKIVPDLNYLAAKGVDIADLRSLFNQLTIRMNKVSDKNLGQDLLPLFLDRNYIQNWLAQWRDSYLRLEKTYDIHSVTKLREVWIHKDFHTDVFSFVYKYDTDEGQLVQIQYSLTDYWIEDREGNLTIPIDNAVIGLMQEEVRKKMSNKVKQYASLFYRKTEEYLKKTHRVVLGNSISTKTIRMTASKFNQKEQIILNRSALLSCELRDLLK
jgi:predicted nucleotidyltransferase component of viral defense system